MSSVHGVEPDSPGHWVLETVSGNLHVAAEAYGTIRILIAKENGHRFESNDIPVPFSEYIDDTAKLNVDGIPRGTMSFEWRKGELLADTLSRFEAFVDTIDQSIDLITNKSLCS